LGYTCNRRPSSSSCPSLAHYRPSSAIAAVHGRRGGRTPAGQGLQKNKGKKTDSLWYLWSLEWVPIGDGRRLC